MSNSRSKKKSLELIEKFRSKNSELKLFPLIEFSLEDYPLESNFICSFPYYSRNYANEYITLNELVKGKIGINQNTINHFAHTWFRNYFINLDLSIHRPATGFIFANSFPFQGKDILFVGAAPILEKQISWIKSNQENLYILSSDTACHPLLSNGIRPDYILSIDSGRGTIFHFKELPIDIPIITWLGANSYIFRLPNPIFLYLSTYPLDQVFNKILFSEKENLIENPSLNVAGISKAMAEKFSANRLILSGISFKSQLGKTHCNGTGYENYNIPRVTRYYPMEALLPTIYRKELSSKNQLALYHLTESNRVQVIKSESISEIETSSSIYKTKPLSLKVLKPDVIKFKKLLQNSNIKKEVLRETGMQRSFYDRIVKMLS